MDHNMDFGYNSRRTSAAQRVRKLKPMNSMMSSIQVQGQNLEFHQSTGIPSNGFFESAACSSSSSTQTSLTSLFGSPTSSSSSSFGSPPSPWSVTQNNARHGQNNGNTVGIMCNFCKGNGESKSVYTSHRLRDERGNLVCPVLRAYVCPQCGSTGDTAHTLSYCPWAKEDSVAKAIRQRNGRNSAGQKKF